MNTAVGSFSYDVMKQFCNVAELSNELCEYMGETMQPYFRARPDYFRHYISIEAAVSTFICLPQKTVTSIRHLVELLIGNFLLAFAGDFPPNLNDKSFLVASFLRFLGILEQFFSLVYVKDITTAILLDCAKHGYVNQEVFLLLNKKNLIHFKEVDDGICARLAEHSVGAREFSRFVQRAFGHQKVDQFSQTYPRIYQYMLMYLRDF